jgi:hypothetical protein
MDYDEVFAPVAKHSTIRFIMSLAANPAAHLAQLDVSTAFLNGVVDEVLFCKQPPGFEVDDRVCRMWKCLYGLKQASRQWYLKVKSDLLALGYITTEADQGLFLLPGPNNTIILWLVLWVDDFFLLSFSRALLDTHKDAICRLYKTRDLGQPSIFVGYEITRNTSLGTLHISQPRYLQEVLKTYGMTSYDGPGNHPHPIPLSPEAAIPYPAAGQAPTGLPLAAIVGSLNYLAVCTRPDIAFAVNRLARHSSNPTEEHMVLAKGILKYLAGTPTYGITYTHGPRPISGFCDSDHASCMLTRKSTTGWVFTHHGGAIAWRSKLQDSVTALSSTEAEYVAASSAAQEALWLDKLRVQAGFQHLPINISGDNQAALNAWNQEKLSSRLRHLEVRFFFLKEAAQRGGIVLSWIPTAANAADMLTKALPRLKFQAFRTAIGCKPKP